MNNIDLQFFYKLAFEAGKQQGIYESVCAQSGTADLPDLKNFDTCLQEATLSRHNKMCIVCGEKTSAGPETLANRIVCGEECAVKHSSITNIGCFVFPRIGSSYFYNKK